MYCAAVANETSSNYMLYLETDGGLPCSTQTLATYLDAQLGELNLEYLGKRASGRLHPLAVHTLRAGTAEDYKQQRLRGARRETQYKPVILHYLSTLEFPFHEHCIAPASMEINHAK